MALSKQQEDKLNEQDRIEDDLRRIEQGIREVKIAYDRFFNGALQREPLRDKFALAKLIKKYHEVPMRSYGQRFKFNALVARYNVMNELWGKSVRQMEEGDRRANAPQKEVDPDLVSKCRVADPSRQSDSLRGIYQEFCAQRKRLGQNGAPTFETFVQGISSQATKLRGQSGCDEIEVRLSIKDRKVQLSAKPGR